VNLRPNTQAANCCESNSSSSSLARHAMLCASGSPCLALIGQPRQCVCRTTHGSVQDLGASHRRANLAAIVCCILAPDRKRIKRSLPASVRRHRRALRIRATKAPRVRGLRAMMQPDRQKPAWPGIDSTDSSADRPPLTGLQRINIRWKAQGLRSEYQQSCSKLAESGSIILSTHAAR
jgi:hypothetical protein